MVVQDPDAEGLVEHLCLLQEAEDLRSWVAARAARPSGLEKRLASASKLRAKSGVARGVRRIGPRRRRGAAARFGERGRGKFLASPRTRSAGRARRRTRRAGRGRPVGARRGDLARARGAAPPGLFSEGPETRRRRRLGGRARGVARGRREDARGVGGAVRGEGRPLQLRARGEPRRRLREPVQARRPGGKEPSEMDGTPTLRLVPSRHSDKTARRIRKTGLCPLERFSRLAGRRPTTARRCARSCSTRAAPRRPRRRARRRR